jgi:hypothetical protein
MGPVRGDFDVLTLESLDTKEWAVAMATLDKHPGTVKGQRVSLSYYSILPGRMGRSDLVEIALPKQMSLRPEGPASRLPLSASYTLQGPGIFAQATLAALLLSIAPSPVEDPVIHIMDGWPRKWDVSFKLQAKGGFLISSSMKSGTIRFVDIVSQLGGECRIRNPWPLTKIILFCNGKKMDEINGSLLKFPTEKGKSYLLVSPLCWIDNAASNNAAPTGLGKIEELRTIVP